MGYPVDCVHCAPALIEDMYDYIVENGGNFNPLVYLKVLQPGGAALSKTIVDALVAAGVNVKTTYGSTEIGPPFRTIPHTRDNPHTYRFRSLYPDNPYLKMEPVGEGVYECVVYKGFELAAELWEGKPSSEPYRTNDLFVEEPTGSGFFTLRGRRDDILVHTNGENTSAGALQLDIQASSKVIERALVVGHSRPGTGLLVEIDLDYMPENRKIEQTVWEAVQEVNSKYPSYSHIRREMIYHIPTGKELPVTPKGNVRRQEAEKTYATEIEELYSEKANHSFTGKLSDFLRTALASLCNLSESDIQDNTSIYDLGIDSRLALALRSMISSNLGKSISVSTIFENPSLSKLVIALNTSMQHSSNECDEPDGKSLQVVTGLITSLNSELRSWPLLPTSLNFPGHDEGQIILLTGVTGSLGTSLLARLLKSEKVKSIYALVRGTDPLNKITKSFETRDMDPSILSYNSKLKVLNFVMQDPLLGLDIDTYYTLAKTVTTVIHVAWKMDFLLPVERFESDCIRSKSFLPIPKLQAQKIDTN